MIITSIFVHADARYSSQIMILFRIVRITNK